jgi:hypothetical protein
MTRLLLVCVVAGGLVTGCSKKRIAECDALVDTFEKVAKCEKLPADTRKQVAEGAKTLKESLKMMDDAGDVGDAPKNLVDDLRNYCRTQDTAIVDEYKKLAPECMK